MQTNVPLQEINPGPTNTACECVWNKQSKDFLLFYLCSSVHSHCPRGWILNFERRKTNLIIKCISLRKGYSFQRMLKPISKAFISMIGHILFISRGKHNSWTFHKQYSTTTVSVTQGGGGGRPWFVRGQDDWRWRGEPISLEHNLLLSSVCDIWMDNPFFSLISRKPIAKLRTCTLHDKVADKKSYTSSIWCPFSKCW